MKVRLIGMALSAAAAATVVGCGSQSAARPAAQSSAPAAAVTTPQPQKTVYVQQPPPATVTVPAAQPPVIIQQAPRTVIVSPAPVPGTDSVGDGGNFYPINSRGSVINVRVNPSTASGIVGTLVQDQYVQITCTQRGDAVSGPFGTTTLWDRIDSPIYGYVSDEWVNTSTGAPVVGSC
jgi:hypothetical protein